MTLDVNDIESFDAVVRRGERERILFEVSEGVVARDQRVHVIKAVRARAVERGQRFPMIEVRTLHGNILAVRSGVHAEHSDIR